MQAKLARADDVLGGRTSLLRCLATSAFLTLIVTGIERHMRFNLSMSDLRRCCRVKPWSATHGCAPRTAGLEAHSQDRAPEGVSYLRMGLADPAALPKSG